MKDFLIRFKRSIKKSYRKIKYLDRTKARFFATLTIISVFCLYPAITYTYFVISEHLSAAVITIANLKYELTSTNTSFKNNSITLTPGQELSLELNLKSLNNMDTKYALDYLCDSPDVKVYYVSKKLQNVEGVIASLNSIIDIIIEIHNNSDSNQTITFNLKGGYLQNNLESNIVKQTPNILRNVPSSNYSGEFWGQKDKIKTVVFETEMNSKENATYTYDVSEKKNKSVMSYLVPDTEEVTDTTTFTLYIQSNGKTIANKNSSYFFDGFKKLESVEGLENLDTSNVTNMRRMFYNCISLTSLDLSNFDTGNVTNMSYMFYMYDYTGNAESQLTNLIFSDKFNTSKVTNMSHMLDSLVNLTTLDVSNFNTSNVTDMSYMFSGNKKLTSLDLSSFNTDKVSNIGGLFNDCFNLQLINGINNWNTSNATNMKEMFADCNSLISLDVSSFNTGKVTDVSWMFYNCNSLTSLDVSNFDTGSVINMSGMFSGCISLTSLDLSSFDTSNVIDMSYMFNMYVANDSIVSKLTTIKFSAKFNTIKVNNMANMFTNCSSLTSLDVSNFSTSKVTNMSYMFDNCSNLASLNVSNFDTSNVTDMQYMFSGNKKITSLDLSSFDTSKVINMSYLFNDCYDLRTIVGINDFDTSNVVDMTRTFNSCWNLRGVVFTIRGTKCTSYVDMFYNTSYYSGTSFILRYTEDASSLVDNMLATKTTSNVVKNSTPEPKYSITLNATSDISLSSTEAYRFTDITINTNKEGYVVSSFKLNGTLMSGNTFKMPGENVTISDVVTKEVTVVESEHNPYANNINNQEYLNKTWSGATSLTVVLEYQTESTNYDWIYLYDKNNTAYGKYGGTTLKTETITIPGDTLRIVFRTDGSGNNYYGFKATITPNY